MSESPIEIPQSTIDEVKAANPGVELHLLGNRFGQAIFRVPTAREYQLFVDQQQNPTTKGTAMKQLVVSCVVHPKREEFAALIASRPGLVATFGSDMLTIAGVTENEVQKKL